MLKYLDEIVCAPIRKEPEAGQICEMPTASQPNPERTLSIYIDADVAHAAPEA